MDAGQGEMARLVAARLRDKEAQRKAGVMPYQMLAACCSLEADAPQEVRAALEDALEASLERVPELAGRVAVCIDVSGSMQSLLTGRKPGVSTKVRCVDVAALYACAVARKNPNALIVPFDDTCHDFELAPGEGVFEASRRLAELGQGGTDCSLPLNLLAERASRGSGVDTVVFLSDNESWMDTWRGTWTAAPFPGPGELDIVFSGWDESLRIEQLMAAGPDPSLPPLEEARVKGLFGPEPDPELHDRRRLGMLGTKMGPFPTPAQVHRARCMEMLAESEEHHARMYAAYEAAYDEWLAEPGQVTSAHPAHAAYLRLREQCPAVRLICIDLQPYGSVQVLDRPDVLNLGGFSDHVFELVAEWVRSPQSSSYWVAAVEAVDLSS